MFTEEVFDFIRQFGNEDETIEHIKQYILFNDINVVYDYQTFLTFALSRRKFKVAEFLIRNNADVNVNIDDTTPLLIAIGHNNFNFVNLLFEHGVHIHDHAFISNRAIEHAMRNRDNTIFKFLVSHGLDLTIEFNGVNHLSNLLEGRLKYFIYGDKFNLINDLMPHKFNDFLNENKKILSICKILSDKIIVSKENTKDIRKVLKYGIQFNRYRLVESILKLDVDVNVSKDDIKFEREPKFTLLDYAILNTNAEMVKLLLAHNIKILPMLEHPLKRAVKPMLIMHEGHNKIYVIHDKERLDRVEVILKELFKYFRFDKNTERYIKYIKQLNIPQITNIVNRIGVYETIKEETPEDLLESFKNAYRNAYWDVYQIVFLIIAVIIIIFIISYYSKNDTEELMKIDYQYD